MDTKKIKRMNIKEFREKGFLQEANRLFFHPLGLALEINIYDNKDCTLSGIWDYRDDPEGMLFKTLNKDKIEHVDELKKSKIKVRSQLDECNAEGIQYK